MNKTINIMIKLATEEAKEYGFTTKKDKCQFVQRKYSLPCICSLDLRKVKLTTKYKRV